MKCVIIFQSALKYSVPVVTKHSCSCVCLSMPFMMSLTLTVVLCCKQDSSAFSRACPPPCAGFPVSSFVHPTERSEQPLASPKGP
jgi:hypothetical protein